LCTRDRQRGLGLEPDNYHLASRHARLERGKNSQTVLQAMLCWNKPICRIFCRIIRLESALDI
jgi:hypothetical protein